MASSHLSVCFFTVPKFGNQVIVPLKGSQHLPTQFAAYARNMDSAWFKESFGMQATEAELVPELASASHRLQRISFSRSRTSSQLMHALLWLSNCSHVVGLVFANHTSIIHYFQTVSLAAMYTRLMYVSDSQPIKQIKVQSDLPRRLAIFCLCATLTYETIDMCNII